MTAVEASRVVTTPAWIRRPVTDLALAFAWVPAFGLARLWADDGRRLVVLTAVVLLLSFAHQPVTLPLVYGDVRARVRLGALLLLAPVAAVGAVYVGLTVSLVAVAIVSAVWNAHHTLRQRYGLVRVYGRKVGQTDGRHEQALLFCWFGVAVMAAMATGDIGDRMRSLPVGSVNHEIVALLEALRPAATIALAPVVCAAAATTLQWVRAERDRSARNPAKYVYLAGAGVLFATAAIDPVAAFLGFMAAHAVEYLVVVERTLPGRAVPGSVLASVSTRRWGPGAFLGAYVVAVLALVAVLERWLPAQWFLSVYLAFGVLHFVYDGLIWKLRTAPVATAFAIDP